MLGALGVLGLAGLGPKPPPAPAARVSVVPSSSFFKRVGARFVLCFVFVLWGGGMVFKLGSRLNLDLLNI